MNSKDIIYLVNEIVKNYHNFLMGRPIYYKYTKVTYILEQFYSIKKFRLCITYDSSIYEIYLDNNMHPILNSLVILF